MTMLVRGWFDDDGGLSHAVDRAEPNKSLCGKPSPFIRDDIDDSWATAPFPRCQRCQQAGAALLPPGINTSIINIQGNVNNSTIQNASPEAHQSTSINDTGTTSSDGSHRSRE